ncbi:hypothetical protein CFP56_037669 [Quercus suber]|uniref:Uncharacterized protein n=1 Tax=Quercus suber TaxID=58331 RepID=A0AAW0J3Z6_QUESU
MESESVSVHSKIAEFGCRRESSAADESLLLPRVFYRCRCEGLGFVSMCEGEGEVRELSERSPTRVFRRRWSEGLGFLCLGVTKSESVSVHSKLAEFGCRRESSAATGFLPPSVPANKETLSLFDSKSPKKLSFFQRQREAPKSLC